MKLKLKLPLQLKLKLQLKFPLPLTSLGRRGLFVPVFFVTIGNERLTPCSKGSVVLRFFCHFSKAHFFTHILQIVLECTKTDSKEIFLVQLFYVDNILLKAVEMNLMYFMEIY